VSRAAKIAIVAASFLVVVGLVVLTLPLFLPYLPSQAQVVLGRTIDTVPGTVDELFTETLGDPDEDVTHEDADDEYVDAASIWPWALPPGWGFPEHRGIPDVGHRHWDGMGVQGAFSLWAKASLEAVESGNLTDEEAIALLDEVEDATETLLEADILSDVRFIEQSVTPLRP
jgi:hypothetical protein